MPKIRWSLMVVLAAGCSSGPKYKVDDTALAQLSVEDRQKVFAVDNEINVAKAEQQKADADLKQAEHELDVAQNDLKSAKLQLSSAKLNKKAAEASGDVNRQNTANRELHVMEMGVKAADTKVDWLAKKRKWLKATRTAAEDRVRARESKRELEKARVAQAKGIKPSEDFDIVRFESESMDRERRSSESRVDADKMKADVDNLERQYQQQLQQYQQAKGATASG